MAVPAVTSENQVDTTDHSEQVDIGSLASWSVSSSKPGYGVDQLIDTSLETLWQSEGPQPHLVNIQFRKRMSICLISMYVAITTDDSYTPQKLSLRAGTHFGDLQEVKAINLDQPKGWQHFRLGNSVDEEDKTAIDYDDPDAFAVRAHLIQIVVLANHANGKDTHIRNIKIYAPKEPQRNVLSEDDLPPFTHPLFTMHRTLR